MFRKINRAQSDISRGLRIIENVTEIIKDDKEERSKTPKSITGMTNIYLPQISTDFPEFNYSEFKIKAENMLRNSLQAISSSNIECLESASEDLEKKVLSIISGNEHDKITEKYEQIIVHKTEISRYEKTGGTCVITLQSAIEYIHYKKRSGKLISGNQSIKDQCKYNIEIMYVQDADLLGDSTAVSIAVCNNCGAPITTIGNKVCAYCGSAVNTVNINVWKINNFQKI